MASGPLRFKHEFIQFIASAFAYFLLIERSSYQDIYIYLIMFKTATVDIETKLFNNSGLVCCHSASHEVLVKSTLWFRRCCCINDPFKII